MQYLRTVSGPFWLTETRQYNARLQMTSQTVAPSGGGAALLDLRYNYHATQNNGRITSMQDLVSGETVTYQYDELQRLISASAAGWGGSACSGAYTWYDMYSYTQGGLMTKKRLRAVRGRAQAESVPAVEEVRISIPVGQPVVPPPEGARYLGFVFARAATPAQTEAALREAHALLDFDID